MAVRPLNDGILVKSIGKEKGMLFYGTHCANSSLFL